MRLIAVDGQSVDLIQVQRKQLGNHSSLQIDMCGIIDRSVSRRGDFEDVMVMVPKDFFLLHLIPSIKVDNVGHKVKIPFAHVTNTVYQEWGLNPQGHVLIET